MAGPRTAAVVARTSTRKAHPARIDVQIAARYRAKVKPSVLRRAAQAALDQQHIKRRVEMTIVLTGNAQLRALNRTFREVDAPTDVLSFSANDPAGPDTVYLGDVVISYSEASEQARSGRHPVEAELQLLVVHGVLHLLGHDHYDEAEKQEMWKAQAAALKKIGAGIAEPKL